jgi:hypothetical protein
MTTFALRPQQRVSRIEIRISSLGLLSVLVASLIGAFAIRYFRIDYAEVGGDEAFSYSFSLDSPQGIVSTTLNIGEPHPVGSYLLLHYWLELAGRNEIALRFPGICCGVLAVAVLYRLGRRLYASIGQHASSVPLIAAWLFALSPFLIAESRVARMYSMSLCLSLLSTWLMLELLSSPGNPVVAQSALWRNAFTSCALKRLIAYVLVSWAALNVHYFSGAILLAQNIYVLARVITPAWRAQPHKLARWVVAQLVILAAFIPWYLLVRTILRDYHGNSIFSPALDWMVTYMAGLFSVGIQAGNLLPVYTWAGLGLATLGAIRLLWAGPRQRWAVLLLVLTVAVPFMLAYLDSRGRSTFAERQVIAAAGPFFLLIAAGLSPWGSVSGQRNRQVAVWVLPGVVTLAFIGGMAWGIYGYYREQFSHPNFSATFIQFVQRYSANIPPAQLRVAQNYPDPGITFYYRQTPQAINLPYRANDMDSTLQAVRDLATNHVQRIILRMDVGNWWNGGSGKDIAQSALSTTYTKVFEQFTGRWTIAIYSLMTRQDMQTVGISFENGLMLERAATRSLTELKTSIPNKYLEVHLSWKPGAKPLKGTEKLFIHILDQAGQAPSQLDVPLTPPDIETPVKTHSVPLADTLPPGDYTVRVGIYDPGQPGAPRLRTSDNADGISIATLHIAP